MKQRSLLELMKKKAKGGQGANVDVVSTPAQRTEPPASDPAAVPATKPRLNADTSGGPSTQAKQATNDVHAEVAEPNSGQPELATGVRLRVYWPLDKAWYKGRVARVKNGKARVEYDDGEVEDIDPAKEKYEILSTDAAAETGQDDAEVNQMTADGAALEDSDVASDEDDGSDFSAGSVQSEPEPEDMDLDDSGVEPESPAKVTKARAGTSGKAQKRKGSPMQGQAAKAKTPRLQGRNTENVPSNGTPLPGCSTPTLATPAQQRSNAVRTTPALQTPRTGELLGRLTSCTPATSAAAAPATRDFPESSGFVELGDASARFTQRYRDPKFSFMAPENIRDAQRRRPDDPEYDCSTCYIPATWAKQYKVSDGQQQWWQFKAANWDKVLLFKMGRFYEMFEMDAFVGVDCLGLQFMKGDQPHAGFPEPAYYAMAEQLARAGHRVVIVEQTETPEQLKAANEKAGKGNKRKVVRRQKVAVLSRGTLSDPAMLSGSDHATYVAAVVELGSASGDRTTTGFCAVDVAGARVLLGQFEDNSLRVNLQKYLTELHIAEVVLPRVNTDLLPAPIKAFIAGLVPDACMTIQPARNEAWSIQGLQSLIRDTDQSPFASDPPPTLLNDLLADTEINKASLLAFSGMAAFLKESLLDQAVCRVGTFLPLDNRRSAANDSTDQPVRQRTALDGARDSTLALDGAAMENMEVFQNPEDGRSGGVLSVLDHTVSPAGKRTLRSWLARPLQNATEITARQDAIAVLMNQENADRVASASEALRRTGDLERLVMRLAAVSVGAAGRDAPGVVLYEEPSKRRVRTVSGVLKDLQRIRDAVEAFEGIGDSGPPTLSSLVSWGQRMPDFRDALQELWDATDWQQAEEDGSIVPVAGVDGDYDAAVQERQAAEDALEAYLQDFKADLGLSKASVEVKYVTVNKDSHVLEVPDKLAGKVPRTFHAMAAKKGVKRYGSDELTELRAQLHRAHEVVELAQGAILQHLTARFSKHKIMWLQACAAAGELDVLMSLAKHALSGGANGPMCRPDIRVEHPSGGAQQPFFQAKGLRHAGHIHLMHGGSFVPNDVDLGAHEAPYVLLTGPNMGGKSTLMRQVCLAVLLAQVGAWVPAEQLAMSPVDAIFVRMGARDRIMLGHSTFFVELSETAAALEFASRRSLVMLDELGRGTATMDGAAIASAVLQHFVAAGCRGIFATHYHSLAEECEGKSNVAIKHMACHVEEDSKANGRLGSVGQVFPLYHLRPGACPKSYGCAVARIAGIPADVAARAAEISEAFEQHGARHANGTLMHSGALADTLLARVWSVIGNKDRQVGKLPSVLAEVKKELGRV